MTRRGVSLLTVVLLWIGFATKAGAQVDTIVIPAGTDEDKALQAISSEQDPQKKLAAYQDFVQKFSANPAAVAYGNWQISQAYQTTGDLPKALEYGDKALAGSPRNLDILVSQASLAQQAKDNSRIIEYAVRGGQLCESVAKESKPADMTDEQFVQKLAEDKSSIKNSCDFMETSGFNVIATENDPKNRMAAIEKFGGAFPNSKFADQVASYAMYTLGPGQLNDPARLVSFGEKTLAANPNSLPALLLLGSYYVEDTKPGSVGKAVTYSQKAIEIAKPNAADADKSRKLSAGVAHSTIGYAYLKEDKTPAAILELKTAATLLKGQDEQSYAVALYRLGFAYAKLNKTAEARDVLTEAVKIQGPLQSMSQELLTKVNAARAKGK